MDVLTVIKLEDVNGQPMAKLGALSSPLRIGDNLRLKFKLTRTSNGRYEVLDVEGPFQVLAIGFDASVVPPRQLLSVGSLLKPPTWRSIGRPLAKRQLAPAKSPRTSI